LIYRKCSHRSHFLILHSSGMSDEDSVNLLIPHSSGMSVKKIRALARILFLPEANNSMEKKKNTLIFLLSILLICSIIIPVSADYSRDGWPLETRANGTILGSVFTDSVCWNEDTSLTLNSAVPDGVIRHAYLYTGIWGKSNTDTGSVEVTLNGDSSSNGLGTINLEGTSDSNDNVWCTGNGKYWIWYNVTDLVNPGATNTATTSKISGSIDGRVYGILLVVVYEGGDDPKQIRYWINDGSDALNYQTPHDIGITNFTGAENTDDMTTSELTMVHLTGYIPSCSDCLEFNNNILNTSCVDSNRFDINTWNVTDYIKEPDNVAWYSRGTDENINVCNAILVITKNSDNWRDEWIGPDSDDGPVVTTSELQDAIHHWLNGIPVRGHTMILADLQEIIVIWL